MAILVDAQISTSFAKERLRNYLEPLILEVFTDYTHHSLVPATTVTCRFSNAVLLGQIIPQVMPISGN